MNTTQKECVLYIRVSTSRQQREGLSLGEQRAAAARFAEREGYTVADTFEDVISGESDPMTRPGWSAAVAAGLPIVVANRDRIARNVMYATAAEHFNEILSMDGNNDSSPEAEMMRQMLAAVAQYSNAQRRAAARRVVAYKRERGEYIGGRLALGDTVVDGKIVTSREGMKTLRLVWKLQDEGSTRMEISAELAGRGIVNSKGNPFGKNQIQRMFARR